MENEESIAESESAGKINKTEIKKCGKYYASYTEDDLQTAIDDVRNNKSTIYSAAKRFKIPFQSLSNRIKEKSSSRFRERTVWVDFTLCQNWLSSYKRWTVKCSCRVGSAVTERKQQLQKCSSNIFMGQSIHATASSTVFPYTINNNKGRCKRYKFRHSEFLQHNSQLA